MFSKATLGSRRYASIPVGNGAIVGEARGVATGIADLAHDVTTLAELQAQLFWADTRAMGTKVSLALLTGAFGTILLIGAAVMGMFSLAEYLTVDVGWTRSAAQAIVAAGGAVVAVLAFAVAYRVFKGATSELERSRSELRRNIAWIKAALRPSSRREGEAPAEPPTA